jgi:hypothetical protein
MQPNWIDDYGAPLGDASEAPPHRPGPVRHLDAPLRNGLVLVNPSHTATASISVGAGYKRLTGHAGSRP